MKYRSHTLVGLYPQFYYTTDGGILCADCANQNETLCAGDDPQWHIEGSQINWEDQELMCDNCMAFIDSAYGD